MKNFIYFLLKTIDVQTYYKHKSQVKQNMQEQFQLHKLTNTIQSSALVWPRQQKQRDQLSFPLSLILRPLEQIDNQELSASFSYANINQYRCHSCKAFVNLYCVIKNKEQYKCSICGCTNWLPYQINPKSPEFASPVFTCKTKNPSFRTNNSKCRTFVFAINLSKYDDDTSTIVHYVVDIIKDFLKQIKQKNNKQSKQQNLIKIMIIGFSDSIHHYRIINNSQKINKSDRQLDEKFQIKLAEEEYSIDKVIDTHLENNQDGLLGQKEKYLIELPKFNKLIQDVLVDLVNTLKNVKIQQNSNAIIPMLERIMQFTAGNVGKVYVITGLRNSKGIFTSSLQNQPEQFCSNFSLNRKKFLPATLVQLLQKTHMSVSFFIYNNSFINIMPLYVISKMTNGEVKHYTSNNYQQLYYEIYYSICRQSFQLGTQTIIKVRYSPGLKLIGIFGQYRMNKGAQDQIQLLSCPTNRIYMFQFAVQGKIQQPYINIQFSILWTDTQGNRIFKVITQSQKISDDPVQILDTINYGVVNQSYLWAVVFNMDFNIKVKNLQVTLQQRCRKHLKAIQKHKNGQNQSIKKATPYIIFTYYLMGHFIINTKYCYDRIYDKSIQARSRIITNDVSGIYAVWPVVYSINKRQIKIVQLRYSQIKNSQIAVLIDQADFCYIYIVSEDLRNQIIKRKILDNRLLIQIIGEFNQLQPLSGLLKQIRQDKTCGYMEVVLLQSLQGAYVLDQSGLKSYSNFINNLVS